MMPNGEFAPTPREEMLALREVNRLDLGLSPETEQDMARWLSSVLCSYRLELLTGESVFP